MTSDGRPVMCAGMPWPTNRLASSSLRSIRVKGSAMIKIHQMVLQQIEKPPPQPKAENGLASCCGEHTPHVMHVGASSVSLHREDDEFRCSQIGNRPGIGACLKLLQLLCRRLYFSGVYRSLRSSKNSCRSSAGTSVRPRSTI